MKATDVINELRPLLDEYAGKIRDNGLMAEILIEGCDRGGETCLPEDDGAESIDAIIYLGTEDMDPDNMLGCVASFDVDKHGEISDVQFAEELARFKTDAGELMSEVFASEDPKGLIEKKIAEAEAEAEAAMEKLEKDIAKIELVGKIAIASLFGIIIILGIFWIVL